MKDIVQELSNSWDGRP